MNMSTTHVLNIKTCIVDIVGKMPWWEPHYDDFNHCRDR